MKPPVGYRVVGAVGWIVLLAVVGWPASALALRIWNERSTPSEASFDAARQLGLLARSAGLAAGAACGAILIALPVMFVVTGRRRVQASAMIAVAAMSTLLCPPMVLVFGWQRILGTHWNPYALTIAVWALWAWPIPATLLTAFWSRTGRTMIEPLLLESSSTQAYFRAAIAALRGPGLFCFFLLSAVFLNEYCVPHACGLTVYATELLGIATSSSVARDTLVVAMPPVLLLIVACSVCWRWATSTEFDVLTNRDRSIVPEISRRTQLTGACVVLAWLIPTAALAWRKDFWHWVAESWRLYAYDGFATLGIGIAASVISIPIVYTVVKARRTRRTALILLVLLGFLPGALIGEAFIAAFNRPSLAAIADHWPVMAAALAARFAWIPALAAMVRLQSLREVREQAAVDGAGPWQMGRSIEWPLLSGPLLAALGCVVVLACGEVPLTSLLRVPDYDPVALVIIEKFHRFEDGLLASLSLGLVAIGYISGGVIAWYFLRKRGN